ncbi:MAG: M20/M25/M40 family metallo-hydrolase [Actinobacteria bacterium]|nr:M20/M25/M40 family metallo-hydrolase [Actinomycetota bacterium]
MRISERLEELYAIGGGPGANRPHGSAGEDEAFEIVAAWMREAGLAVEVEPDGNLFGHVQGSELKTGPVWTGSHLDTVPAGGRFDGALGVVAGIEAVEGAGVGSVVAFRGEEVGCIGSRALVAHDGVLPSVFLELHVEQGPVLERAGAPLGVVTSIAGMARGELLVEGTAGHAGTVPMDGRRDALVAAATEILRIRDAASAIPGAVATVGELDVEPGAGNVIPSRVRLSLDARAPDRVRLDALVQAVGFAPGYRTEPVTMAGEVQSALRAEIEARGLPLVELSSGAGHDAGILAAAGVKSGMLFVRSLNGGVSHCPEELSSEEDIALATEVLVGVLRRLAG